jgi:hypothetical protein
MKVASRMVWLLISLALPELALGDAGGYALSVNSKPRGPIWGVVYRGFGAIPGDETKLSLREPAPSSQTHELWTGAARLLRSTSGAGTGLALLGIQIILPSLQDLSAPLAPEVAEAVSGFVDEQGSLGVIRSLAAGDLARGCVRDAEGTAIPLILSRPREDGGSAVPTTEDRLVGPGCGDEKR